MTIEEAFEAMPTVFNPAAAKGLNKTFQWNITGEQASKWGVKIENETCTIIPGGVERPDITLTISDNDWLNIIEGKLDAMNAFMTGKLKVSGDMMLAMRLQNLFPVKR